MDKISVVVPTYNNAPWLPACLNSLLEQTYENLEIIVVDDGSTDETGEILREYERKSPRIHAICQENAGVTRARLRGVAEASGDWIGFTDGDDVVDPTMFARLLENARTCQADISHCGYRLVFPDGRSENHQGTGQLHRQTHLAALQELLEERSVEPGLVTKLFRRELFAGLEEKMEPDIQNNEDMLMNFFLFEKAESAVFEDICPYCYQARAGSASRRGLNEHRIYDPIRVRKTILSQCEPQLQDAARQALLRTCLYVYAQLTMEAGRELAPHRRAVRREIAGQKDHFSLLSRRNRVLARMICLCPPLFFLAFRGYVAVALHGKYE